MAVDDFFTRDTESLVCPSTGFYPLKIPVVHYQLRHYINAPEQDVIYYVCGPDVYSLNVATRNRTLLTTLPFEARCTAARHGWLCVGGEEDGHFAALRTDGAQGADVDDLLPLDIDARTFPSRPTAPRIKLERIGEEIVNSISIHKLPSEDPEVEGEVVAVLTNNDKTVRIYSLTQSLEVAVLDLPFPMNHASISPDGNLLVAVGDYQQAYFFERTRKDDAGSAKARAARLHSSTHEWAILAVLQLHVPATVTTGYFTTAWSPSGTLCAVGSECGYVSVVDVEMLMDEELQSQAVVQIIRSTRPAHASGPGAVRAMMFAPPPMDLLVWAEDQGRVCVADLRTGLRTKQVLELDARGDNVRYIHVVDVDTDGSSQLPDASEDISILQRTRRILDAEGSLAGLHYSADGHAFESPAERRNRHRHAGIVESDDDPNGLTAQERQILDALSTARQREEARQSGATPRSYNYHPTAFNGNTSRSSGSQSQDFPSLRQPRDALGLAPPTSGSLRDFIHERYQQEGGRTPFAPRRHPSVVIPASNLSHSSSSAAPASSGANTQTHYRASGAPRSRSPLPMTDDSTSATHPSTSSGLAAYNSASTSSASASTSTGTAPNAISNMTADSPEEIWRRLRAHRLSGRTDTWVRRNLTSTFTEQGRLRNPHHTSNSNQNLPLNSGTTASSNSAAVSASIERLLAAERPRERETYELGRRGGGIVGRSTYVPGAGVRTAGLAMSGDGRTLWVGTEEGIFEFDIDVKGRKSWPALVPA